MELRNNFRMMLRILLIFIQVQPVLLIKDLIKIGASNLQMKTTLWSIEKPIKKLNLPLLYIRFFAGLVSYGNESGSYRVEGILPDYQFLEKADIIEGRFINMNDVKAKEKYAVIGNRAKKDLFKDKSPIGEYIEVSGLNFKVIGVFTDPGGDREETRVYVPISTAQIVFGAGTDIRSMGYTLPKEENYDLALKQSNAFAAQIEQMLKI